MARNNQSSKQKKTKNGHKQQLARAKQKAGEAGTKIARREGASLTGSPFAFMRERE